MTNGGFAGGLVAVPGAGGQGALEQFLPLLGQEVSVTAIAASKDGRVAVGGNFRGRVDFGGHVLNTEAEGGWGFVAVYDSAGRLSWAKIPVNGAGSVTGLSFAPDGGLVAQGTIGTMFLPDAPVVTYVVKLASLGEQAWDTRLAEHSAFAGKLVTDSRGDVWAGAQSWQPVEADDPVNDIIYLYHLSSKGSLLETQRVSGQGCVDNRLTDLTISSDDHLIATAGCTDAGGARSAFMQERDVLGTTLLEKRFVGVLNFSAGDMVVSVDSKRRITTGGGFWGSFTLDGLLFSDDSMSGMSRVWLASFDPSGKLDRHDVYRTRSGAVAALAYDPNDDLLVLATCQGLDISGTVINYEPEHGDSAVCVVKVDRSGLVLIWNHAIEGDLHPTVLVSDSTGHVWIGGNFYKEAWYGSRRIPGNEAAGGLLLRLNP